MEIEPDAPGSLLFAIYFMVVPITRATAVAGKICTVSPETGTLSCRITFSLRASIDMASDDFYAHLRRRKDPKTDILICEGGGQDTTCYDKDPAFRFEGTAKHALTIQVPNMTRELEDTYVLQVYSNGSKAQELSFNLTAGETADESKKGTDSSVPVIVGVIVSLLVIIIVVAIVLYKCRCKSSSNSRFNETACPLHGNSSDTNSVEQMQSLVSSPPEDRDRTDGTSQQAVAASRGKGTKDVSCDRENMLQLTENVSNNTGVSQALDGYPWYFGSISYDEVKELLAASKNIDGSFLVIDSTDKNGKYFLKVNVNNSVVSRLILRNKSGFRIEDGRYFQTVPELIEDYYRLAGCLRHKLTVPCSTK